MLTRRGLTSLAGLALLVLTSGCGGQSGHVLAPDPGATSRTVIEPATARPSIPQPEGGGIGCNPDYDGPILTLRAPRLNYTYPTGGYFLSEARIVSYDVTLGRSVKLHWSADASGGCTDPRKYRWALDIADVTDETPRIDEDTDLSHWSQWSVARSIRLGPFTSPGPHLFMVDVEDGLGYRSLGIIRIEVTADPSATDEGWAETSD